LVALRWREWGEPEMVVWGYHLVTIVVDLVNARDTVVIRVLLAVPVVFNSDVALRFMVNTGRLGNGIFFYKQK
jgi:hypothetical protein